MACRSFLTQATLIVKVVVSKRLDCWLRISSGPTDSTLRQDQLSIPRQVAAQVLTADLIPRFWTIKPDERGDYEAFASSSLLTFVTSTFNSGFR